MSPNCDARYERPTELPLNARTSDNISKQYVSGIPIGSSFNAGAGAPEQSETSQSSLIREDSFLIACTMWRQTWRNKLTIFIIIVLI